MRDIELEEMKVALRKSEEEALRSADELAWVYHYAPIGLCQFDLDLRFLRINAALAEMNGLSVEDHLGRTVHEVVPSLAPAVLEITQEILSTGEPVKNYEFSGETPSQPGVERCWNESWYPVFDRNNKISGFGVVAEEITERKKSEKAMRDLIAQYELVLSGAGDAIWDWDVPNHRAHYSKRWKELHGYGATRI